MVTAEKIVETHTVRLARSSLPPYSMQSKVELVAEGIMERTTAIPKKSGSLIRGFNIRYTAKGHTNSLIKDTK